MGLPEPYPSVNKEGVVVFRWKIRHGKTGCIGKLVACPHNKVIKCVFGVKHRDTGRRSLRIPLFWSPRSELLFGRSCIPDSKLEETSFLRQMRDSLLNL